MKPAFVPASVGALAAVVAWNMDFLPDPNAKEILLALGGALASVGSTLLGFMLAALAVLASINHAHLIQTMRKSGHYKDLLATLFAGSATMMLCTALGFSLLFGIPVSRLFLALVFGCLIGALASLFDTGRKMWLVLEHLQH